MPGSGLSSIDMQVVESVLGMETGYVLDFTNRTFDSHFKQHFGIDPNLPQYTAMGSSKAKRLRAILAQKSPVAQAIILRDLLEYYDARLLQRGVAFPDPELRARYEAILDRLDAEEAVADEAARPVDLRMLLRPLGSQRPTHLGRLRRFARILTGSQRIGDTWVRKVLPVSRADDDALAIDDNSFDDLVKALVESWEREPDFVFEPSPGLSPLQQKAAREVGKLTPPARAAFAASWVETFDRHELAHIFDTHQDLALGMADLIELSEFAEVRNVLISAEDDTLRMIEESLAGLPYAVTPVHGAAMARSALATSMFDLLLFDARDDRAGAAPSSRAIVTDDQIATIWISDGIEADRKVVAAANGDLVARPFDEFEIDSTFREALYVEPHRWVAPDDTFAFAEDVDLSNEALAPTIAPIDATVVAGRLTLADTTVPAAAISLEALDGVRDHFLTEAQWQADEFRRGNGAPRVQRHLDALVPLLQQALSEQMLLRLMVGVDGLARELPTIETEMMPLVASDIASFVTGLEQFIVQFPVTRQYRADVAASRPVTPAEDAALRSFYAVLIAQPASAVDPALREQLELLERARTDQPGPTVGDVARVSSLSNVAKAPARAIKEYGADLLTEVRKYSITALSSLIVGLATAAGLHHLAIAFPEQFAAVYVLLTRAKKQLDEAGLSGDTGED